MLMDYVDSLETAVGAIEGATTLHNKLTAARAALLDTLDTAETSGTFSKVDDVLEQTIFTFAAGGLRTKILGIWLDLVNLTQNATIRIKFQVDGTNYRTFDNLVWITTDDDGVFISPFAANDDVQVSIQSAVLEGAARDIPYLILYQVVE